MSFLKLPLLFLQDIWTNRWLLGQLVMRDFKNKYIGSYLGFVWNIVQPFVMIFVLWLVFTQGFKAGPVEGIPFIAFLCAGLIFWDFFSNSWSGATNVFSEYNYLVKQINFNVAILPLVKIFSGLISHLILIVIAIAIFWHNQILPSIYWAQIMYYLFCGIFLLLGMSWITSSLQVFLKDTGQLIAVILQFGFWLTPIMWHFKMLPEKYWGILDWNPIFYIINGYRESFFSDSFFWENMDQLWKFWGILLVINLVGVFLFRKLRPHFADVL